MNVISTKVVVSHELDAFLESLGRPTAFTERWANAVWMDLDRARYYQLDLHQPHAPGIHEDLKLIQEHVGFPDCGYILVHTYW